MGLTITLANIRLTTPSLFASTVYFPQVYYDFYY
jgi:hypothetical protein